MMTVLYWLLGTITVTVQDQFQYQYDFWGLICRSFADCFLEVCEDDNIMFDGVSEDDDGVPIMSWEGI